VVLFLDDPETKSATAKNFPLMPPRHRRGVDDNQTQRVLPARQSPERT
jgi:hypothetical protein